MTEKLTKEQALQALGRALFGKNNLIASDFQQTSAKNVKLNFLQDSEGVLIQFAVSHHALGKALDQEAYDALEVLRE